VNPQFIPVIIDFGAATCYIENRYIGSYDYIKDGMLNFMVPGHDIYKFLVYCAYEAEPVIKDNIRSLFRFYGDNDPYNIEIDENALITSKNEYCKKVTFSQAATYTPLMFVEWLLKEYSLEFDIFVSNRVHYRPIQYSSLIKEYDKIFKYTKDHGIEHVIESIKKCITSTSSYVITKYNIKLLERYNDNLQSDDLSRKIKNLNKYLDKFEDKFIDIDNAMLENVFDIKIPTQKELDFCINNVIGIKIRCSKPIDKEKAVKDLDIILSYQENLKPHLQFYFTILELNLKEVFSVWIKKFKESRIYLFHIKNIIKNERAKRWSQTLMASIM
jgi:hypothetical protein